ncbi:MAG: Spy/CpxP family protein refolding chaperone [Gemmatimonadota bacterium]
MRNTLAALVAIVLATAPAMAQEHHHARADSSRGMGMMQDQSGMMQGGMMQMMHGQSGMMMGMAMGPGMILRLEESLDLTENQVAELEMLRDSVQPTMGQHMMQGMQLMQAASAMLDSDAPDLDAYEARLREAMNHMVLAHASMARAGVEGRQVLTPEQRERLSLVRQVMDEMHSGMMGGGMMSGGMMDPGMMNQGGGGPDR